MSTADRRVRASHPRLAARRGQAALWIVPLLAVVAVAAWVLSNLWAENARLRDELARKGGAPATSSAAPPATRPAAAPAAAPAGDAPAVTGGRTLSEEHAKAMRQVLEGASGSDKRAWIQVPVNDPEANALATQIAGIFKQAGWSAETKLITGMMLKPGIYLFEAEETSPEHVASALEALKAAGLTVSNAAGYRAFYEEKKRENPKWVGIELAADQVFALVIGPKPAS